MTQRRVILITGAGGLLGRALVRQLSAHQVTPATRAQADLTQAAAVDALVASVRPEVVIHCAAMTAVDACETQRERAFAENQGASAHVADASHRIGAHLIALSTDYVFSGELDRPYHELDAPGPRTVYGQSKLAAEIAVRERCPRHTILRTAWLYGHGGPSFLHTMLRLCSQPGPPLPVVDDQRGNPTSTAALAAVIGDLVDDPLIGVVHASCAGATTWFGFAQAIAAARRLPRPLVACTTRDVPRPAPRPANSRLEKRALARAGRPAMPGWEDALAAFLREHPDD